MNDATKPCPYCGEQILAVAVKCKHCGSMLRDAPSGDVGAAVKKQFTMRPAFAVLGLVIVSIFAAAWVYNYNTTGSVTGKGFSDADIKTIEQSIRDEFTKRPHATVEEVQMLRESPRQLKGFAKIRVPILGTVNKSCTATMGDDGRSFWQCT